MTMPAPLRLVEGIDWIQPVQHVLFGRGRHSLFGNETFKAPIDRRDCGFHRTISGIEKQRGETGLRAHLRDAAPHGAGAEDRNYQIRF